jgi:hypothetical protein
MKIMTNLIKMPAEFDILRPQYVDGLMRYGNLSDGGYVLPKKTVEVIDGLVSFGISSDWSFEKSIQNINPSISVHCYDHTISGFIFFKKVVKVFFRCLVFKASLQDLFGKLYIFIGYFLFFRGNIIHFKNRVVNKKKVRIDADLDLIISKMSKNKNLLFKIDIEGSEYKLIKDLIANKKIIPLLAIEFHDVDCLRRTFLEKINWLLEEYRIVHVHANNYGIISDDGVPDVLEITFLRKDLVEAKFSTQATNKKLDFPNNPRLPDYVLDFGDLNK